MKKNDHEKLRKYSVSSTGERNIVHSNGSKPYCVSIARNKQKFNRLVDTIEEGVKIRDRALDYYRRNGHLPKDVSELLPSKKAKVNKHFYEQVRCSRCKAELEFTNKESFRKFEKSDNLCKDCIKDDRRKTSDLTDDPMKYISWHKTSNLYMVSFKRRGRKILIYQPTIEDAKIAREKIESFYDQNLRLPTREEAIEDLGIEVLRTGRDSELKNIAVIRNGFRYVAHLTRDGIRHSKTFVDLESAKLYRDYLIELDKEYNRFPTAAESKEKVNELNNLRKEKDSLDE